MLIYVADSTILYSSVCKTNVPVYECIATDWILIGNVREECICSSDQRNFLHALLKKCKTFFFSNTPEELLFQYLGIWDILPG